MWFFGASAILYEIPPIGPSIAWAVSLDIGEGCKSPIEAQWCRWSNLAIFSTLALVGAILITISYQHLVTILQISLAAYYCRFRWGWEEKEVKMQVV